MNIEKSIPIPDVTLGAPTKYPFTKMEVGDSSFFGGAPIGPKCKPYIAAKSRGYASGKKFTGRTVDGGVRIWRVA